MKKRAATKSAFKVGVPRHPKAGRRKGTPNKLSADLRTAFKELSERNIENVERWLERVALRDPNKATELFLRLNEYVLPKLRSVEVSGPGGKPLETVSTIKREIIDVAKKDDAP